MNNSKNIENENTNINTNRAVYHTVVGDTDGDESVDIVDAYLAMQIIGIGEDMYITGTNMQQGTFINIDNFNNNIGAIYNALSQITNHNYTLINSTTHYIIHLETLDGDENGAICNNENNDDISDVHQILNYYTTTMAGLTYNVENWHIGETKPVVIT